METEKEYDVIVYATILRRMKNNQPSVDPIEMNHLSLKKLNPIQLSVAIKINKIAADKRLWANNTPGYLRSSPYNKYLDQSCIRSNNFIDIRQQGIKGEVALVTWKWKLAYMVVVSGISPNDAIDVLNGMGYLEFIQYID